MKPNIGNNTLPLGAVTFAEPMTISTSLLPAALLIARAVAALVETASMFTENQSAQGRGEWPPFDNGNFQAILLKYKIRLQDTQELEALLSPPIAGL